MFSGSVLDIPEYIIRRQGLIIMHGDMLWKERGILGPSGPCPTHNTYMHSMLIFGRTWLEKYLIFRECRFFLFFFYAFGRTWIDVVL